MADELRIDSHKLIYHPVRVAQWLEGKNVYPVTVEVSLSGACNHRCVFCALDYLGYNPVFLDKEIILDNLKQMVRKGVKGIVYAGEGEPLLNKDACYIIRQTKSMGLDVAMSTNGVLFNRRIAEECLPVLSWVRVSLNAGTSATHKKVHRGGTNDFDIVIKNLRDAAKIKKEMALDATLGVQCLLIPESAPEILHLAEILRDTGVDYFTVKPFSRHPKSGNSIDSVFSYDEYIELEEKLAELETENFKIFFRSSSMKKIKKKRDYEQCLGLPFWAYIDAQGKIWACLAFIGDEDFYYGSLQENSFTEIWEGQMRVAVLDRVKSIDISDCRELCRLDEINKYLHQLLRPGKHVNFI